MTTKHHVSFTQLLQGVDELGEILLRKDISGGQNTRTDAQNLKENEVQQLTNIDIGIPGQAIAVPGTTEIDNITDIDGCFTMLGFEPDNGTNSLRGIFISGAVTIIKEWAGAGNFTSIASGGGLLPVSGTSFGQVFKTGGDGHVSVAGSATTNWFEIDQAGAIADLGNTSGTGSDSPPSSDVAAFYNDRWWILKDNRLYYSDAIPADYSNAFSTTTQVFNMTVGEERFLIGIRNKGLICGGKDLVRYLTPSTTPAATDGYGVLVEYGCEAGKTAKVCGDDILYLAKDGVRAIYKTQYDTLQYGTSLPLSYPLKDDFDLINWAYIKKACAVWFDNKYFIALPTSSSTVNNVIWIYYPATKGWITISGISIGAFATLKVNGQERLYATSATTGKVWRMWYGSDFDGTNITYTEIGRYEDLDKPLQKKTGGEFHCKVRATGSYTINIYLSIDESDFNKIGEISTQSNYIDFTSWIFPMIFQGASTYTRRISINEYGRWYKAQYKLTCTGSIGNDLIVLERGIRSITEEYLPDEET